MCGDPIHCEYRKLSNVIGPIFNVLFLFIRTIKSIPQLNQLLGDIDCRSRVCSLCENLISSSKRGMKIHFQSQHNLIPDVSLTQSLVIRNWFTTDQENIQHDIIQKAKEINIPELSDFDIGQMIDQIYFQSIKDSISEELELIKENEHLNDVVNHLKNPERIITRTDTPKIMIMPVQIL